MSATLDQVSSTLATVAANQATQSALLTELVQEVAALKAGGQGATPADLDAIEAKLLAIQAQGSASIAAVPAEDLPAAQPVTAPTTAPAAPAPVPGTAAPAATPTGT